MSEKGLDWSTLDIKETTEIRSDKIPELYIPEENDASASDVLNVPSPPSSENGTQSFEQNDEQQKSPTTENVGNTPLHSTNSIEENFLSSESPTDINPYQVPNNYIDHSSYEMYEYPRPALARLWDSLPTSTIQTFLKWGIIPPVAAKYQSILGPVPGSSMIIGPVKSGKTTFIGAIQQACLLSHPEDFYRLLWRHSKLEQRNQDPQRLSLNELLKRLTLQVIKGPNAKKHESLGATSQFAQYNFNIEGRSKEASSLQSRKIFDLEFSFFDTPGELMFPLDEQEWRSSEEQRDLLMKTAKNCKMLILCFDITLRSIEVLAIRLPEILQQLQNDIGIINPLRVLIILNKVDVLAYNHRADYPSLTPLEIAQRIKPIKEAKWCLGVKNLRQIKNYLAPNAEMTVALISTTGFQPNGYPVLNDKGKTLIYSKNVRGDEIMEHWRPYGIYEVLVYLATGKIFKNMSSIKDEDLEEDIYER